jgi:hypothetical protein
MPSGFSEGRAGRSVEPPVTVSGGYGAPGFIAAVVTILALEFLTGVCLLAWYFIPVIVVPAVILIALAAWALTRGRGPVAQVGRGMLMGCISAPLTLVILIPTYLAARAAGLV